MSPVDEEKRRLRREMKALLGLLDGAAKADMSAGLCAAIAGSRLWSAVDGVAAFMPLPDEPDLRPLLARALKEGKGVFLPRIDGANIVFHKVQSIEDAAGLHAYGMREPPASLPRLDRALDRLLFLVPGLAFDRRGGRLGRGKGYYDRFFRGLGPARPGFPLVLGAAFSCQIRDRIPVGDGDFPMRGFVTEREQSWGQINA
jgi:5-formyltetrahydrofolate cyclo-ligase